MKRLQDIGMPLHLQWAVYTLYEIIIGKVRAPRGISDSVTSNIGVKQGCPLSPTLFGLYIDEIQTTLLGC